MLLLKTIKKTTPQSRFKIRGKFFNSYNNYGERLTKYIGVNKKLQSGRWGVKNIKFYKKNELKPISNILKIYFPTFIVNVGNYRTKLKEYTIIKNIYGSTLLLYHLFLYFPGFKLYPLNFLKEYGSVKKFIGQCVPLLWIPINMPISYVYNIYNNKNTYVKSSGSCGVRKRMDKHTKLINILLPSGLIKIFPVLTLAVFGKVSNLNINKIYGGGWGYFYNNKKKINVRGVAKNPVDHPNGGRTKAKQPELSPWGWIAKQNK